jgi:hypothetical protein
MENDDFLARNADPFDFAQDKLHSFYATKAPRHEEVVNRGLR